MSNTIKKYDLHYVRKAILLSWFTISYNFLEGIVSIIFGVKDEAISLVGFGGDSLIEVGSALVVLWHFRGEAGQIKTLPLEQERRATFIIGTLFLLLAGITVIASSLQLISKSHPGTTLPGLIISTLSLSFMFYLYNAKKKVAIKLDSLTVMKDADCSLACIKLSAVLLIGSLIFLVWPTLWWVDSLAGIILGLLIGKEGFETIKALKKPNFSGGCGC